MFINVQSKADGLEIVKDPKQNFYTISGTQFSNFIVDDPADLVKYHSIQFSPLSFERLTIVKVGKRKIDKSWDFNATYRAVLQEEFTEAAIKIFDNEADLVLNDDDIEGNLNVLFFIESFKPSTIFYEGVRMADLDKMKQVGVVSFKVIFIDSASKKTVAFANAISTVARNGDFTANSLYDHKKAWKDTFSNWQKEILTIFSDFNTK